MKFNKGKRNFLGRFFPSAPLKNNPVIDSPGDQSSGVQHENDSSGNAAKVGLIALGATALLLPNPAHAGWMDSLAAKLSSGVKNAITPVFEAFGKVLSGDFSQIYDRNSSKVTTAIGGIGDQISTVITESENNRIKGATKPPPDSCASDAIGAATTKATANARAIATTVSVQQTNKTISSSHKSARRRVEEIATKYGGNTGQIPAEVMQVSAVTGKSKLNAEERDKAIAYQDLLVGNSVYQGSQKLIEAKLNSNQPAIALDAQAMVMKGSLRLQVAQQAFIKATADRDSTATGDSKQSLIQMEIDRTYGDSGEKWRAEICGYTDPVPLLIEEIRLTAFNNYLLSEMLLAHEQAQLTMSVQLLELMDANRDKNLEKELAS